MARKRMVRGLYSPREVDMSRTVVVRTVPGGKFANEVSVGGHRFPADEGEEVGGTDRGAAPFELVMAGLGACTSMTLRMYADRKGWDLQGVEVTLTRTQREGTVPENEIRREIRLAGDLDAEQRRRLVEIAEKCPVHRALSGGVAITTAEIAG
jgi:putative redox protein